MIVRGLWNVIAAIIVAGLLVGCSALIEGDGRALQPISNQVRESLLRMGSSPEEAMMIRIYKQESELEVWKRVANGTFQLFKTYEICTFSGDIGPKIREGDRQSPEGFYTITRGLLNPRSDYYLAFNLGFPNKFDRAYGRTGSNIMVHGDCSSRGCYAMTDETISEIYALARDSFSGGNSSFQVQIFPFRMTPQNFALNHSSPNLAYWENLRTGFDHFEETLTPPSWDVCNRQYVFNASPESGDPLEARAACPALRTDAALVTQINARQQVHQTAFDLAMANIAEVEVQQQTLAAQAAATEQSLQERGAAISNLGSGISGFFSGLFGGTPDEPVVADEETVPTITAPIPQAPPARS